MMTPRWIVVSSGYTHHQAEIVGHFVPYEARAAHHGRQCRAMLGKRKDGLWVAFTHSNTPEGSYESTEFPTEAEARTYAETVARLMGPPMEGATYI